MPIPGYVHATALCATLESISDPKLDRDLRAELLIIARGEAESLRDLLRPQASIPLSNPTPMPALKGNVVAFRRPI